MISGRQRIKKCKSKCKAICSRELFLLVTYTSAFSGLPRFPPSSTVKRLMVEGSTGKNGAGNPVHLPNLTLRRP